MAPKSPLEAPWVELAQGPDVEPTLRATVEGTALIAAGTHRSSEFPPRTPEEKALPEVAPDARLPLVGYEQEALVRSQFKALVAATDLIAETTGARSVHAYDLSSGSLRAAGFAQAAPTST